LDNIKVWKIDLSNISYQTPPEELEELVLRTAKRKKIFWTFAVEEKINTLIPNRIDTYQVKNDKEYWWTNLNPLMVLGLVIAGIYLLFQIPKMLTNKNRH
jgi:hypothetical protein